MQIINRSPVLFPRVYENSERIGEAKNPGPPSSSASGSGHKKTWFKRLTTGISGGGSTSRVWGRQDSSLPAQSSSIGKLSKSSSSSNKKLRKKVESSSSLKGAHREISAGGLNRILGVGVHSQAVCPPGRTPDVLPDSSQSVPRQTPGGAFPLPEGDPRLAQRESSQGSHLSVTSLPRISGGALRMYSWFGKEHKDQRAFKKHMADQMKKLEAQVNDDQQPDTPPATGDATTAYMPIRPAMRDPSVASSVGSFKPNRFSMGSFKPGGNKNRVSQASFGSHIPQSMSSLKSMGSVKSLGSLKPGGSNSITRVSAASLGIFPQASVASFASSHAFRDSGTLCRRTPGANVLDEEIEYEYASDPLDNSFSTPVGDDSSNQDSNNCIEDRDEFVAASGSSKMNGVGNQHVAAPVRKVVTMQFEESNTVHYDRHESVASGNSLFRNTLSSEASGPDPPMPVRQRGGAGGGGQLAKQFTKFQSAYTWSLAHTQHNNVIN